MYGLSTLLKHEKKIVELRASMWMSLISHSTIIITENCFLQPARTYEIWYNNLKQSLVETYRNIHKKYKPVPKQCILLTGTGSGVLFQEPNLPHKRKHSFLTRSGKTSPCLTLLQNLAGLVYLRAPRTTLHFFFVPLAVALSVKPSVAEIAL